jgi:hypothetical protein
MTFGILPLHNPESEDVRCCPYLLQTFIGHTANAFDLDDDILCLDTPLQNGNIFWPLFSRLRTATSPTLPQSRANSSDSPSILLVNPLVLAWRIPCPLLLCFLPFPRRCFRAWGLRKRPLYYAGFGDLGIRCGASLTPLRHPSIYRDIIITMRYD